MKQVLKAIFDPPWWFLLFGWPVMFIAALFYAWPANMDRFLDDAATPQLKLAVVREIKGAEQRVALEFAAATLRKIGRYVPDGDGEDGIDKALEEIHARILRGYQPPPPKAVEDKAEPEQQAKPKRNRALSRLERRARERARQAEQFGIQVDDEDHDVHINLGIIDQRLARALEAKYGADPLPALDAALKEQIYAGVKKRVNHLLFGLLAIVLLVLSFPFFISTKIVASIIRMFSSRAETSQKVAEQNALARQLTEARLAAMQAQIEPHFLFNTLASVHQLIVTDPPVAAKMQADLIKYLRAAIPQMRESTTTLAREAELSRAYLDILKIRMEDRLFYVIDIPPELGAAGIPPMMLPTLVENAIKHGLEPRTEGGEIRISARAADGKLRVSVADTGMGFADQPGTGVGLANIRERLMALYGKAAQLIVEPNLPRGAKVTFEIPYPGMKNPK